MRLPPEVLDLIKRGAIARRVSQSALIIAAVRAYLDANQDTVS